MSSISANSGAISAFLRRNQPILPQMRPLCGASTECRWNWPILGSISPNWVDSVGISTDVRRMRPVLGRSNFSAVSAHAQGDAVWTVPGATSTRRSPSLGARGFSGPPSWSGGSRCRRNAEHPAPASAVACLRKKYTLKNLLFSSMLCCAIILPEARLSARCGTLPSGKGRPNYAWAWPNLDRRRRNLARAPPNLARIRPNLSRTPLNRFRPTLANIGPNLDQVRPTIGQI